MGSSAGWKSVLGGVANIATMGYYGQYTSSKKIAKAQQQAAAAYAASNEKVAAAIKIARRYRLRVRRSIVRRTVGLSPAAQYYVGHVLLYYGISGMELVKNDFLQGRQGIYHIKQGTSGKIAEKSFKVQLPMQEGHPLYLDLSLLELQSGIFITEGCK